MYVHGMVCFLSLTHGRETPEADFPQFCVHVSPDEALLTYVGTYYHPVLCCLFPFTPFNGDRYLGYITCMSVILYSVNAHGT
jgi:hypothetical protein